MTDQILHGRVNRDTHRLQDVDLVNLLLIIEIREHPIASGAREDCVVRLYLLPVSERLIVRVEEELVLDDAPTQRAAELVLVQERLGDAIFVVKPGIGRERIVAVVPIPSAVILVTTGRSSYGDL